MSQNLNVNKDAIVKKVISYAKQHLEQDQLLLFKKFAATFYQHVSYDDLINHDINTLFNIAYSQQKLVLKRIKKPVVKVFNPTEKSHGFVSSYTLIQVASQDMPFIVDSVQMILNRCNINIHLSITVGGMRVQFGQGNKVVDCSIKRTNATDDKSSVINSTLFVEIDQLKEAEKLKELKAKLEATLTDVETAVKDWHAMREKMAEQIELLEKQTWLDKSTDRQSAIEYLKWLQRNHFTYSGYREYKIKGQGEKKALALIEGSGLGILRDESKSKKLRYYKDLPKAAREAALGKDSILILSQTNTRSTIHRDVYTDSVEIKQFNKQGEVIGEVRFIGLYTSSAYSENPEKIPFIKDKFKTVIKQSGLNPGSHAGKHLAHVLANLPREDLFHANVAQLYDLATAISQIQERRRIKTFVREDQFERYVSCLVYLPRENYNSDVVRRIILLLEKTFKATEVATNTNVSESLLARLHFVVRVPRGEAIDYDLTELRDGVFNIARSWRDAFRDTLLAVLDHSRAHHLFERYRYAFAAGYREHYSPTEAFHDVRKIEQLTPERPLKMSFYYEQSTSSDRRTIQFKIFQKGNPIILAEAVPLLENMGLKVLKEQPFRILLNGEDVVWMNHFTIEYAQDPQFSVEKVADIFRQAFYRTWHRDAENDGFNRLVLEAQLNWRQISVLRAYAKYFKQIGSTFTQQYIEQTLLKSPHLAKLIIQLFEYRFDPAVKRNQEELQAIYDEIELALDKVAVLDEDRIMRLYVAVIDATLRTNYYQVLEDGDPKPYLSFKLRPEMIPGLPLPLPKYEIFVYSPRFEGVHLRMAKVARGGLRWSDRPEDYRTEILGLMKAQQVKNAVIVPAGAKGGFVPYHLPIREGREAVLAEAIHCYQCYISGLLDVIDNIAGKKIVKPQHTVCYDGDDTYLVVAADKGTATFSDIANKISLDRGFWLGDAFASGGSTGYDHKAIGITARGAWVSGERHFQELGCNLNETEVTTVGIGDMSGDVFGNGMLLSKNLKLIAAFNHMHIFIDPTPDPKISYQERKRLFELPRSSWLDYSAELISKGGGVFDRKAKAIKLSPEARKVLDIEKNTLEPNELIRAILMAPVDMVWNGGIGTYVKASAELNVDVGDRINDPVRVNGNQLRAKVVCEGGNLGLTQLGRIEYESTGGLINTDFIDNSAGVDCSDHEVNAKILLNKLVQSKRLTLPARNKLLFKLTNEVASLVLHNNYVQNRALSISCYNSSHQTELFIRFIDSLEEQGKLNRQLEFLPSTDTLLQRKAEGRGLTRPELSVLLAYSKIVLEQSLIKSELLNDPYVYQFLKSGFPAELYDQFTNDCKNHPLAKDLIATQLSNKVVGSMGITFIYRLQEETAAPLEDIVKAYLIIEEVLQLSKMIEEVDALNFKVDVKVQYEILSEAVRAARRCVLWMLRNRQQTLSIKKTITKYSQSIQALKEQLPHLIVGHDQEVIANKIAYMVKNKVPQQLAERIANLRPIYHAFNITSAISGKQSLADVAQLYFLITEKLELFWLRDQINDFPMASRWTVLAKAGLKADLDTLQRELAMIVLQRKEKTVKARFKAWQDENKKALEYFLSRVEDLMALEQCCFEHYTVLISQLRELMLHSN